MVLFPQRPLPVLVLEPSLAGTGPHNAVKSLIFLRKSGAGEGIRTLDPNLGKGKEDKEKQRLSSAKAGKTGTQN